MGRHVLDALRRCDPRTLEQETVNGGTAYFLELRGERDARRDLREAWDAWMETYDEMGRRRTSELARRPVFEETQTSLLDM